MQSPERTAAEKALTALRENRPASAELGTLRTEVLNLQKENRDLRKDLDELKKKLEAAINLQTPPKGKSDSKKSAAK